MSFTKLPGLRGKVYDPPPCPAESKKHPCLDCFDCQHCGDDRCSLCRGTGAERRVPSENTRECEIPPR